MLRRHAPSVIKRENSINSRTGNPRKKYKEDDSDEDDAEKARCSAAIEAMWDSMQKSKAIHETFIKSKLGRPFKIPMSGYEGHSDVFLGMRKKSRDRAPLHDPTDAQALVLYTPPVYTKEFRIKNKNEVQVHVVVDPILCRVLRPHQREGVEFMYRCVTGRQIPDYYGSIMADDMGLGKTLQCISLMWTLLRQSPDMCPEIHNVIIVCPSSLVKNWANEIFKWLNIRLKTITIDSGQGSAEVDAKMEQFASQKLNVLGRVLNPVLIVSYETFRGHQKALNDIEIGLMICDEGHRLKNLESQTYVELKKVKCKRRIIISGTPIQNDLLEYYSLVDFVNPGLLGTSSEFKKHYENPITKGRDADASERQLEILDERLKEMLATVNKIMIRRTSLLLAKYLPLKYELIVCCSLEPIQKTLYEYFIKSKNILKTLDSQSSGKKAGGQATLQAITFLKKLCNHPQLVFEMCQTSKENKSSIFEGLDKLFPDNFSRSLRNFDPLLSSKMKLLDTILAYIKAETDDRVVLISNYTQTMDLFQRLCDMRNYKTLRLDGSLTTKKRDAIVTSFNDPTTNEFIFMLSSKAGGCGLNLIGANRLIMFDPDWNPANDGQAMARVWRDGQRKECFLYRFLSTGTIEEKIFQRQTHKKALSSCVVDSEEDVTRHFSVAELKELFRLEDDSIKSDTHRKLNCKRCKSDRQIEPPPTSADCGSDLADWCHCYDRDSIPDEKLRKAWPQNNVSFVFYQKQTPDTSNITNTKQKGTKKESSKQEETSQGETSQDENSQDEHSQDENSQDEGTQEDDSQEEARIEHIRREQSRREDARREETKQVNQEKKRQHEEIIVVSDDDGTDVESISSVDSISGVGSVSSSSATDGSSDVCIDM